jgi:hypothetical protein
MLVNNHARLNVWLKLKNKFDYAEYVKACEMDGVVPHNSIEFAQKVGMIMCGITAYPDKAVHEAYVEYAKQNESGHIQLPPKTSGCGSCGGGKTR